MESPKVETTEASKKTSPCDDEIELMRLSLARQGRLSAGATDQRVREEFAALQVESAVALEAARVKREAEAKTAMRQSVVNSLKTRLRHYKIDATGMTEDQMRQRLTAAEASAREIHEQKKREEATHEARRKAARLFAEAGCPPRHIEHLSNIDPDENPKWREIRDLLAKQATYRKGYLVALLGKRGPGKTQICTSVIQLCCESLLRCRYVKAQELFRDLRRAYTPVAKGERAETETGIVERWASYDLLVIDETQVRSDTAFEDVALTNLIDRRYDAMRCTILVANQTKEEFGHSMGSSIVSRLHETGEAIVCDWPSYRKPGSWRQPEGAPLRHASTEDTAGPRSSLTRPRTYGEY